MTLSFKSSFMPSERHPRFAILEMYIYFWGKVRRKNLQAHFDMGGVSASRLIKAYDEAHPGNLYYCVHSKAYIWRSKFIVHYPVSAEVALTLLCHGQFISNITTETFGTGTTTLTPELNHEAVAALTRALTHQHGVSVNYTSTSSGFSRKHLFPTALFQSSQQWYFRAYDAEKKHHRSYKFSRVFLTKEQVVNPLNGEVPKDTEWDTTVVLTLAPHGKHKNPEALKHDLGLRDQPVHNVSLNAVIAPFVLNELRVDCSASGCLNPNQFPLQLLNREELQFVQGIQLTPGYEE